MVLGDGGAAFAAAGSLLDLVARWAVTKPDAPAYTYVDYYTGQGGGRRTTLTWAETHRRAGAMAARLRRSAGPGDRVALLLPQGLEYLIAMLGAMYAGVIAVPLFAPDLPGQSDRLAHAYADADPAVAVVASATAAPKAERFIAEHGLPRPRDLVIADELTKELTNEFAAGLAPAGPVRERVPLDATAYLQYTSGSTRRPTGVRISHRNISANTRQVWAHFSGSPRRPLVVVSWLPLFHDMGLIATLAIPILYGRRATFTDPMAFIRRPRRWLELLSGHLDTEVFTVAPNFGYDYCLTRVRDPEDLDLRRLRWCLNGAEPVRQRTMEQFAAMFATAGLRPQAMVGCYGLAEATVFVTAARGDAPPKVVAADPQALGKGVLRPCDAADGHALRLVSCGRPTGQYVAIVDPKTCRELPADRIGEIWVHGPNVSAGYWGKPQLGEDVFGGRIVGAPAEVPAGPWLRTGDLGVIHQGELFVTGRIKDLIIVDGQNHFPHDIEATVEDALPAARPDHVAAFAIATEDGERLIVVAERSSRVTPDMVNAVAAGRTVRGAVAAAHGVQVHDFLLVRPGGVPRTSSGKVARGTCRQRYLDGLLPAERS
jgi:fatty acid CoA ligase FadD32